ncbi:MAG TPA: host attachment protein [Burkholderiales bacterium]|jgi:protein required for attachment to host cells|nr:host attachment protein [Burkholderiales bacterium]
MDTTWIVVADRSRARIFEEARSPRSVQEIADFVNPAGRARHSELTTDAEGRSRSTGLGTRAHSESPGTSADVHEAERFSREVAEYLEHARNEHRFERLWLVAAPKFLAMLRKSLSREAHKLVEEAVAKDLSRSNLREIDDFIVGRRKTLSA